MNIRRGILDDDGMEVDSEEEQKVGSGDDQFENNTGTVLVQWEPNDPDNPHNFSKGRKIYIVVTCLLAMTNGTINTSLSAGATPYLAEYFGIDTKSEMLVVPMSLFLAGYGTGPIVWAPISEAYGRRTVFIPAFIIYTAFTLGCALASNWVMFLVFRFIVGFCAGCPFSVVTGIFSDIYGTKKERGYAIMLINAISTFGPILGPIVAGFTAPHGWRIPFWIALGLAGITFILLSFVPETYRSILLERKAAKMRDEHPNKLFITAEPPSRNWKRNVATALSRPTKMLFTEPLVSFNCLYLALLNGIYYLSFESYPFIYQKIYGMKGGVSFLPLIPIALGAGFAGVMFHYYGKLLLHMRKSHNAWLSAAYERLPLACLGGPLFSLSLFWLGWSSDSHRTPWIVPTLSSFWFGAAIELVFIAMTNYITDAYGEKYSASAAGASCTTRYLVAAVLPIAAKPMYKKMGIGWGASTLGFASAVTAVVPIVFMRYDVEIKRRSHYVQKVAAMRKESCGDAEVDA